MEPSEVELQKQSECSTESRFGKAKALFPVLEYSRSNSHGEATLQSSMISTAIGIDLGNISVKAAVPVPSGIQPVAFESELAMPAAVLYGENNLSFGTDATRQRLIGKNALSLQTNFVSELGVKRFLQGGALEVTVSDAIRGLVQKVRDHVVEWFGPDYGDSCVLTHSVNFSNDQIDQLKKIAAGVFNNVTTVSHPIAVALAADALKFAEGDSFLICDFGASQFSCSFVVRNADGQFHLGLPPSSIPVGGNDFERRIADELATIAQADSIKTSTLLQLTAESAEAYRHLKESLSSTELPVELLLRDKASPHITIARKQFEPLISEAVDRFVELALQIASTAAEHSKTIDSVILVGGGARIPFVSKQFFEKLPIKCVKWNLAVQAAACGAVVLHGINSGAVKLRRKVTKRTSLTELVQEIQDEQIRESEIRTERMNERMSHSCRAIAAKFQDSVSQQNKRLEHERHLLAQRLADGDFSGAQDSLSVLLKFYPEEIELKTTQEFLDSKSERIGQIRMHNLGVTAESLAFSTGYPRGLACLANQKLFAIDFDLMSLTDLATLTVKTNHLLSLGNEIVLLAGNDGYVRKYSVQDKKELQVRQHGSSIAWMALSSDASLFATCCNSSVKVWSSTSVDQVCTLQGESKTVSQMAFVGLDMLATIGANTLEIWEIATGRLVRQMETHHVQTQSICSMSHAELIFTGGADNNIRLWAPENKREVMRYEGGDSSIIHTAICPDGRHILGASTKGAIHLWHVESGRLVRTFTGHQNTIRSLKVSGDGKYAVSSANDNSIRVWSLGIQ